MSVATAQPLAAVTVDSTDTGSNFWDWFLFGLTVAGAAIVYVSIYLTSAAGFIVGEAICLGVALVGIAIKFWHKRQVAARLGQRDIRG